MEPEQSQEAGAPDPRPTGTTEKHSSQRGKGNPKRPLETDASLLRQASAIQRVIDHKLRDDTWDAQKMTELARLEELEQKRRKVAEIQRGRGAGQHKRAQIEAERRMAAAASGDDSPARPPSRALMEPRHPPDPRRVRAVAEQHEHERARSAGGYQDGVRLERLRVVQAARDEKKRVRMQRALETRHEVQQRWEAVTAQKNARAERMQLLTENIRMFKEAQDQEQEWQDQDSAVPRDVQRSFLGRDTWATHSTEDIVRLRRETQGRRKQRENEASERKLREIVDRLERAVGARAPSQRRSRSASRTLGDAASLADGNRSVGGSASRPVAQGNALTFGNFGTPTRLVSGSSMIAIRDPGSSQTEPVGQLYDAPPY